MGQIMAYEQKKEPNPELATRTGEFAMLIYSVGLFFILVLLLLNFDRLLVGVAAGTILPHLAARDRRLMGDKADVDETAEISRLRATVRQWRIEAARKGRALHLPVMPFLLRNIWTGALLFFSLLMFSTFFISTVFQARLSLSTPNVHVLILF